MKQLYFLFIFLFFNICLSITAENVKTSYQPLDDERIQSLIYEHGQKKLFM